MPSAGLLCRIETGREDPQGAEQADRPGRGRAPGSRWSSRSTPSTRPRSMTRGGLLAGTLTPALTWGIFGLLAGGVKGLAVWAVVGAICGGLYAYYSEHLLTKDELKRIGGRLPVDSSALVAFVRAADPRRLLSSAASYEPTTASVAEITPDLSAQVLQRRHRAGGAPRPAPARPGCRPGDADGAFHRRARREAGVGRVRIREAQRQEGAGGGAVHRGERARSASGDRAQDRNRRLREEPTSSAGGCSAWHMA